MLSASVFSGTMFTVAAGAGRSRSKKSAETENSFRILKNLPRAFQHRVILYLIIPNFSDHLQNINRLLYPDFSVIVYIRIGKDFGIVYTCNDFQC